MKIGEMVTLQKQNVKVELCQKCRGLMVNIDANQIEKGDMVTLKGLGLIISNPETPDPICIKCEIETKPTFRRKAYEWFKSDSYDDSSLHSSSGSWGGSSSGGGFGGFGGGLFGGGGAGRGF